GKLGEPGGLLLQHDREAAVAHPSHEIGEERLRTGLARVCDDSYSWCFSDARNSMLPSVPLIGEAMRPRQLFPRGPVTKERIFSTASSWRAGSFTMPPLPTCSFFNSNWGLMRQTRSPPGRSTSKTGPRLRVREMNETSTTTRSTGSGRSSAVRYRKLTPSRETTRSSLRNFYASWLVPTS